MNHKKRFKDSLNIIDETDFKNHKTKLNKILEKLSLVDICCVCLCITDNKTICEHSLCNKCYHKISNKKCPLCRLNICKEEDKKNIDNSNFLNNRLLYLLIDQILDEILI